MRDYYALRIVAERHAKPNSIHRSDACILLRGAFILPRDAFILLCDAFVLVRDVLIHFDEMFVRLADDIYLVREALDGLLLSRSVQSQLLRLPQCSELSASPDSLQSAKCCLFACCRVPLASQRTLHSCPVRHRHVFFASSPLIWHCSH